MTLDVLTPTPAYTIDGEGPYTVSHGYLSAYELLVEIDTGTGRVPLSPADFTVSPEATLTGGALTLEPEIAEVYEGARLAIARQTAQEQGFTGEKTRDKGLEAAQDRVAMSVQDTRRLVDGTLRVPLDNGPLDRIDTRPEQRGGKVIGWTQEGYGFDTGLHLETIETLTRVQIAEFPLDLGWANDPVIFNQYDLGWANE